MQPSHEFFWAERHTVWSIALKFSIAYEVFFAQLLVKKIAVRSRSYNVIRGTTSDKITVKSWENATWRSAVDLNGDNWWDWCQYLTRCDPWNCTIWVSRSTKFTWGHWPRLTSQWQIANRHVFSGVSWGDESEFVVICSQKRLQTTSSPFPRPISHSTNLNFDRCGDDR